jgi:hypothetical protein
MGEFLLFVLFVGAILVIGYFKAKKKARSTPAGRMMYDARLVWDHASPAQRAKLPIEAGLPQDTNFVVYLNSTWAQLDFNLAALLGAVIQTSGKAVR